MLLSHAPKAIAFLVALIFLAGCNQGVAEKTAIPLTTPTATGEHGDPGRSEAEALAIPPFTVSAACSLEGCMVAWPGPGQNIPYFRVYRRATSSLAWELIGRVDVGRAALGEFHYADPAAAHGVSYVYGVSAVNYYQRESEIVPTSPVSMP